MKKRLTICLLAAMAICSCSGDKQQQSTAAAPQETITSEEPAKAQENKGTIFHDITLSEALERAKAESKLVFIECHTKSCGPCRMMKKDIFPQEKVGNYINSNFISIMRDVEEGEGIEIAQKYNVGIYPTYLIVDAEGNCVGQVIGVDKDADSFIQNIKDAAAGKQ